MEAYEDNDSLTVLDLVQCLENLKASAAVEKSNLQNLLFTKVCAPHTSLWSNVLKI